MVFSLKNVRKPQREPSRMTVPQGSACVEPYAQAMELTSAQTMKKGTKTRQQIPKHETA